MRRVTDERRIGSVNQSAENVVSHAPNHQEVQSKRIQTRRSPVVVTMLSTSSRGTRVLLCGVHAVIKPFDGPIAY